jgi:hypothetical protein
MGNLSIFRTMILPMRMIGRFDLYVIDFVKNIG